jgi:hypothetical protein
MVAVAILLMVAVVIGHLLPGLDTAEIHREIRNALHVIGFALIAAVVFESLSMRAKNAALVTLLIVAALGALAEFAQNFDGKGFDLEDFYRDIAGAALYLCARLVWQWSNAEGRASAVRFSARFVSIVLGVLLFLPLGYWLSVNARIAANFPTILDFDGRWDSYLYLPVNSEIRLVSENAANSEFAGSFAEVILLHRRWSGLKVEPVVSDWSSYQFLTMRAAIDGEFEGEITVEISDGDHPGYRVQHFVGEHGAGPEPAVIRIPLHGVVEIPGRPDLDTSNIMDVYIIAKTRRKSENKDGVTRMLIDDIRLE